MLTEFYIEALLADEDLADRVWEAWNLGQIGDIVAAVAWNAITTRDCHLQESVRCS